MLDTVFIIFFGHRIIDGAPVSGDRRLRLLSKLGEKGGVKRHATGRTYQAMTKTVMKARRISLTFFTFFTLNQQGVKLITFPAISCPTFF
ncbi:hypothetical protein VSX61_09555 [Brenneria populi subsp. brevivirga]|uniref:hypothetical protein n=1 Tax=Brenneria populi TaxID=1505588 RepID=UPI002E19543D|nr:hypothetical protein [Brenneria populi subsp. brevivirga]